MEKMMEKLKNLTLPQKLTMAGIAVVVIIAIVFGCIFLSNGEEPDAGDTQKDVIKDYTIEVKTESGKAFEKLEVHVFEDDTLTDLVAVGKTDEKGIYSFSANASDKYVAVLKNVPAGYPVETSYAIKGDKLSLVLKAQLLSKDEVTALVKDNDYIRLGDVASDISVTVGGKSYTVSELLKEKKAVVINFWFEGCEPCKAEFPYMEEAYKQYSDKLEILAVNPYDGDENSVAAYKESLGLTFPVAKTEMEWASGYNITACPTTIVIDRFGTVAFIHSASIPDTTAQKNASSTKEVAYEAMKAAILAHSLSSGYKSAISSKASDVTNQNLLDDYDYALKLFKEELESDYISAQESYTDAPYDKHDEFKDEIFCFMYSEGYVETKYAKDANGKEDRTNIESLTKQYPDSITTKEAAIDYVYNDVIARELDIVLLYWATGSTLTTEYTAKAKEVILHENMKDDGTLAVQNISGIVSLGHTTAAGTTIKVNGTDYTVASGHNEDGTVTNENEYDVLQITIDGIDPKAIWNFAITIAPQHYYGEGSSVGVDIANNKFGVEFASFSFMTDIVQSPRNIKLPMGAGSYKATDSNNSDTPSDTGFYTNNVVYFKANTYFETVAENIENAKIEKIRYQVVSSNNAISKLEDGSVHFISPSLTTNNYESLEKLAGKGMVTVTTKQLGYGYVGINAKHVSDINLRKAIMCAMNTSLALDYYRAGTAEQIYWPMSKISWAYPDGAAANDNGKDYPQIGTWSEDIAKSNIEKYMQEAGVSAGDSQLKITFTIAGSSLQDHPTYKVFRDAATLLNSLGWEVNVVCDTQALTKINTGSLAVWAAAWSSALDPDMYQVYHKDSTATSTLAWGYNFLKTSGTNEELKILDDLSDLIEQARETNDQSVRADLYEKAMGEILDLAIELPVYQRSVLYAYNSKVIDTNSLPTEVNPYSSPLDRIWEIEFAK